MSSTPWQRMSTLGYTSKCTEILNAILMESPLKAFMEMNDSGMRPIINDPGGQITIEMDLNWAINKNEEFIVANWQLSKSRRFVNSTNLHGVKYQCKMYLVHSKPIDSRRGYEVLKTYSTWKVFLFLQKIPHEEDNQEARQKACVKKFFEAHSLPPKKKK